MRAAFVLQLDSDTHPAERRITGRIEEVDTGRELRFRSTDELLAFLCQCFELAQQRRHHSLVDSGRVGSTNKQ